MEDDAALESLQRALQKRWGKQLYKERYKELKKNHDMWVAQIQQVRLAGSQGRGTRRARPDAEIIERVVSKSHSTHKQAKKRWMTYPALEESSGKAKGGQLSTEQSRKKWQSMLADPRTT